MLQRTLSGIAYLVLIIVALFAGKFTFGLIMLFFGVLALYEFYKMTDGKSTDFLHISGIIIGAGMILTAFFVFSDILSPAWLSISPLLFLALFVGGLFTRREKGQGILAMVMLGLVYVVLPLSLLTYLAFPASFGHAYAPQIVLGIFILIWVNDIMAYLVGISIGRHRLFKRVSPKKSWEGAIGGAIFTLISAIWMDDVMQVLAQRHWLVLAGIVSVFGVLGDLFESMFKRNADLKDSGTILPGHGGILDRIDSMLFVAPVAFAYLLFQNL